MPVNVNLQFAAQTDTGIMRPHNEDSVAISMAHGVGILADGMGGYNAGEVASGIATAMLLELLETRLANYRWQASETSSAGLQQLMVEAIQRTNQTIFEAAESEPRYRGMGTTLVAALLHHDKIIIAHVGDSRAYRLRAGKLQQITRDHSLLQEQIDAGEISAEWSRYARNSNLVTRAIGVSQHVEVEIHDYATEPDDLYILCSDGLSDMLSAQEINQTLISLASDLPTTCDSLIQQANGYGGRDNISVILIRVGTKSTSSDNPVTRIRHWIKQRFL